APVDAVAKETLGIDGIEAELLAQLLAQLADVAFHYILLDLFVEDAVDRIEDLGFGNAASTVGDEVFENATFAARQSEDFASNFRITPIGEDPDLTDIRMVGDRLQPPPDRRRPSQDLPGMNGLANNIIDAAVEKR